MGKRERTAGLQVALKRKGQDMTMTGSSKSNVVMDSPQIPSPSFPPINHKDTLMNEVLEEDQIILIHDAFDIDDCRRFIKFIDTLPLELTPPPKKGEAERVNLEGTDRVSIPSKPFSDQLFAVLSPHLPTFPYPPSQAVAKKKVAGQDDDVAARPAHSFNSNIRLYKYTQGQHFGCHYDDWCRDEDTGARSEWTLLIYLSGEEDGVVGGETIFYKGKGKRKQIVKPPLRRGMALLHRHGHECLLHEGALVQKGTKYVLRSDVMFMN